MAFETSGQSACSTAWQGFPGFPLLLWPEFLESARSKASQEAAPQQGKQTVSLGIVTKRPVLIRQLTGERRCHRGQNEHGRRSRRWEEGEVDLRNFLPRTIHERRMLRKLGLRCHRIRGDAPLSWERNVRYAPTLYGHVRRVISAGEASAATGRGD